MATNKRQTSKDSVDATIRDSIRCVVDDYRFLNEEESSKVSKSIRTATIDGGELKEYDIIGPKMSTFVITAFKKIIELYKTYGDTHSVFVAIMEYCGSQKNFTKNYCYYDTSANPAHKSTLSKIIKLTNSFYTDSKSINEEEKIRLCKSVVGFFSSIIINACFANSTAIRTEHGFNDLIIHLTRNGVFESSPELLNIFKVVTVQTFTAVSKKGGKKGSVKKSGDATNEREQAVNDAEDIVNKLTNQVENDEDFA